MSELSKVEIERLKRDVAIKIGAKIREIRLQQNLTQIELADLINSDRQYLYKIENAKVGISLFKLAIITKALKVPLTKLVDIDV